MSTRRPRGLSAEDEAIWADIVRTVRPLRKRRIAAPRAPVAVSDAPPAPAAPTTPPPRLEVGAKPAPRVSGPRVSVTQAKAPAPADRGGEKRVRRGQVEIGAKLDLHGFTQDQAFAALTHCLFAAQARGDAVVLVVTGKGGRWIDGEAAPGVLKRRLPEWLASPALNVIVSGVAQAHARHGGSGAFYVFIRRDRAKV